MKTAVPGLDFAAYPARPPSEVEWEELLVRLEIAPRALSLAVEQADGAGEELEEALRWSVATETAIQAALAAMGEDAPGPDGVALEREAPGGREPVGWLVDEFARLRARTFIAMQRRGIGVWEWRARGGMFDGATTYQLLSAAVAADRERLERVRATIRRG